MIFLLHFNSSSSTSGFATLRFSRNSVVTTQWDVSTMDMLQNLQLRKKMLKILRPYSCTFTSPHLAASLTHLALLLIQLLQYRLIEVSYLKNVSLRSFIVQRCTCASVTANFDDAEINVQEMVLFGSNFSFTTRNPVVC